MRKSTVLTGALAGLSLLALSSMMQGCGKGDPSDGSGSEIATSTMAGATNSSEGSVAFYQDGKRQESLLATLINGSIFESSAQAATCASVMAGVSCASTMTVPLASCTTSGATWTGNNIFTFTSGGPCTGTAATLSNSPANAVFTRTTDTSGIVRTAASGATVTVTTQDSSGFATAKTGGATVTCGASGCATSRTIVLNGIHLVGSAGLGWDHTVSTDTSITVTGTGSSRQITGGVIRTQHNKAKIQTVTTINGPLTHNGTCCFPISGSVTTAISGGKQDGKTETMTFGSTCGQATLTDSNGGTSAYTLTHCI